jgi:hypothetical protein
VIEGYGACADFSTHPCVVTVDSESCRPPEIPEAGADAAEMDAGPAEDASTDAFDGASPDASPAEGGPSDASLADAPAEAAPTDAPAE